MAHVSNKRLMSFLVLSIILAPSFATIENFITIQQYRDLNASTAYINEFMLCYTHNSTNLNWATYSDGMANITDGVEHNGTYTLSCCDNCHIANGVVVVSTYSLQYDLDTVNITEPTEFNYYVGDILDSLHGINLSQEDSSFSFENYEYFIPLIFIIGLGMFLFVLTESIIGFIIGAVLGLIIGLIYLIASGFISGWYIIGGAIILTLVMISWTKLKSV